MTAEELLNLFMPQFIHPAEKEDEEDGNSTRLLENYTDQISQCVGSKQHLVNVLTYHYQVVLYRLFIFHRLSAGS